MNQSRYSRQILFSDIAEQGQRQLQESRVLIVGMGALGTVLANHMVRAGVGLVRFVDRDFVEESNLQRQMLFDEQDVREKLPKAIAAERKLRRINSEIKIEGIVGDVTPMNIDSFGQDMHLILDGTDNFRTRFIMNDFCFEQGIPYIYGGAVGSRGMQASFIPGDTPCLRCLIEDQGGAAETCDTSGVLAPIIDMVASLQAIEAIKILIGKKEKVRRSLITFDIWQHYQHEIKWKQNKEQCLTCQMKEYPALQPMKEDQFTALCGRDTIQISPTQDTKWDLTKWKQRLEKVGIVEQTPFLLRCTIENMTMVLFTDGRVLIQGTEDISVARSLYTKYIGM